MTASGLKQLSYWQLIGYRLKKGWTLGEWEAVYSEWLKLNPDQRKSEPPDMLAQVEQTFPGSLVK